MGGMPEPQNLGEAKEPLKQLGGVKVELGPEVRVKLRK